MFSQYSLFVVEFRDATRVGGEVGEGRGEGGGGAQILHNSYRIEFAHVKVFAPCYPLSARLVSWIVLGPCRSRQNGSGGVATEQAE